MVVASTELTERELYETMNFSGWMNVLQGRAKVPRRPIHWNYVLTPSESSEEPLDKPSETVLDFAERTGLPKDASVVDLGAGNGRNIVGLYKMGWTNLLGVDLVRKNLEEAEKLAMKNGIDTKTDRRVRFVEGDIRHTGLDEGRFDLAISTYVLMTLQTLDDIKAAADETRRILKPNGYLILATMGTESFYEDKLKMLCESGRLGLDVKPSDIDAGYRLEKAKQRYLGKPKEIDKYLRGDRTRVLHAGAIYLSENTLRNELFPDFEFIRSSPFYDVARKIYNHFFLMQRR